MHPAFLPLGQTASRGCCRVAGIVAETAQAQDRAGRAAAQLFDQRVVKLRAFHDSGFQRSLRQPQRQGDGMDIIKPLPVEGAQQAQLVDQSLAGSDTVQAQMRGYEGCTPHWLVKGIKDGYNDILERCPAADSSFQYFRAIFRRIHAVPEVPAPALQSAVPTLKGSAAPRSARCFWAAVRWETAVAGASRIAVANRNDERWRVRGNSGAVQKQTCCLCPPRPA